MSSSPNSRARLAARQRARLRTGSGWLECSSTRHSNLLLFERRQPHRPGPGDVTEYRGRSCHHREVGGLWDGDQGGGDAAEAQAE